MGGKGHVLRGTVAALLLGSLLPAARAAEGPGQRADALEVLADLTLIDGACRNMTVNFGTGFRFAADQGVTVGSILPGGPQRPAFERVMRERRAAFGQDELCGEIAANYAEALPGSVSQSFRPGERP